jgi:hypothetical protein
MEKIKEDGKQKNPYKYCKGFFLTINLKLNYEVANIKKNIIFDKLLNKIIMGISKWKNYDTQLTDL